VQALRGPARRVAITAVVIGLLWIATVVVALTRYDAAVDEYAAAGRQAQTQRALGLIRENLLDRVNETDQALRDGRRESARLGDLESDFDDLDEQARTVGAPDADTIRRVDRVSRRPTT
jgi:hypothetical protein